MREVTLLCGGILVGGILVTLLAASVLGTAPKNIVRREAIWCAHDLAHATASDTLFYARHFGCAIRRADSLPEEK